MFFFEYSVFPPFVEGQKKEFRERISTIDSRGFFINGEDTEGTLDPKTVTLIRKTVLDYESQD